MIDNRLKNYPRNIWQGTLLVVLIMLLSFSVFFLFNYFSDSLPSEYSGFINVLGEVFSYLIPFLCVHLICQRKIADYNFKIKNFKIVPLIILTSVMLDLGIGLPLYHLLPKPFFLTPDLNSALPGAAMIIGSLVIAPFFEELIMRGIILDGLLKSKSVPMAIGISAILFTAMHLSFEKIPILLLGGIFLGWVYAKTRSLLLTMLMHFFSNLISIYELVFFKELRNNKEGLELVYGDNTILLLLVFNSLLLLLLYLLKRQFGKSQLKE